MNAWEAFAVTDVVMAIAIALAVMVAVVDWFRLSVSLPVAGSGMVGLVVLFALLMVVYRTLNPPGGDGVEREPALYAGLALLFGIFGGAVVGMMEDHPPKPMAVSP